MVPTIEHTEPKPLTPAEIMAQVSKQRVPRQKGPMPIPPPPPSTEKWSFRDVKGTRQKIKYTITGARLTDPVTRKPGDQPLPKPVVDYLLWIVDNRKGEVFVLDGYVHAATDTEWLEHLHLKSIT